MMENNDKLCNFLCPIVIEASVPYYSFPIRIHQRILDCKSYLHLLKQAILAPPKNEKGTATNTILPNLENDTLNLQPDEWVQVRSIDEISATLDGKGKYKGLYFMPEMEKFCGKKFKVFKKAQIIKLESTGEVRKLRSPSIFLEGVYCNGERHEGCDRACFHFWREAWLKRISDI
jgi:hypothetical protein